MAKRVTLKRTMTWKEVVRFASKLLDNEKDLVLEYFKCETEKRVLQYDKQGRPLPAWKVEEEVMTEFAHKIFFNIFDKLTAARIHII